jgi:hypothetical protein
VDQATNKFSAEFSERTVRTVKKRLKEHLLLRAEAESIARQTSELS